MVDPSRLCVLPDSDFLRLGPLGAGATVIVGESTPFASSTRADGTVAGGEFF